MTERENKELKQKQDDEILQEINGEEEVEYGLTNDYMFRSVFQTSEEALRGLLSALLYIPEERIGLYPGKAIHSHRDYDEVPNTGRCCLLQ